MYITRNIMGLTFILCVTDTVVYMLCPLSIVSFTVYGILHCARGAWYLEREMQLSCDADGYRRKLPLPKSSVLYLIPRV